MRWHDMDGGDWLWMTTMMVVFWAVVVTLVMVLIRRGPSDSSRLQTPEDILRERLARGEINPDDYQARLRTLHESAKR